MEMLPMLLLRNLISAANMIFLISQTESVLWVLGSWWQDCMEYVTYPELALLKSLRICCLTDFKQWHAK